MAVAAEPPPAPGSRAPDEDPREKGFADRLLRLDTTMDGAGRITGDLTPECAAAVTAVLESLDKRRGREDLRSVGQRYHDALQEGWVTKRASCWVTAGGRCRSAAGGGTAGQWTAARCSTEVARTSSAEGRRDDHAA